MTSQSLIAYRECVTSLSSLYYFLEGFISNFSTLSRASGGLDLERVVLLKVRIFFFFFQEGGRLLCCTDETTIRSKRVCSCK